MVWYPQTTTCNKVVEINWGYVWQLQDTQCLRLTCGYAQCTHTCKHTSSYTPLHTKKERMNIFSVNESIKELQRVCEKAWFVFMWLVEFYFQYLIFDLDWSLTPLSIIHKKFCYDSEASLRKAIVLPLISADTSSLCKEDRKVEGELY